MKLSDLINENNIILELRGKTKQAALHEVCDILASNNKLDPKLLFDILIERERLGSTGIGDGIAIPHGKSSDINKMIIGFARSSMGIDFQSIDDKPAHLFFILITPETSTGIHLRVLASISKLLQKKTIRGLLTNATTKEEIIKIIRQDESQTSQI